MIPRLVAREKQRLIDFFLVAFFPPQDGVILEWISKKVCIVTGIVRE